MTEAAPFMQGVRAHLASMPKHMNPYRIPGHEQSNWDDGWDHAEEYRAQIVAEHAVLDAMRVAPEETT